MFHVLVLGMYALPILSVLIACVILMRRSSLAWYKHPNDGVWVLWPYRVEERCDGWHIRKYGRGGYTEGPHSLRKAKRIAERRYNREYPNRM